jgi:predicted NodU family carbamoyl transferase
MVKKREEYRPFAPSVLEEYVQEYFEVPESQTTFPYMIFVLKVKEEYHSILGAITHVDGTARVQTVAKEDAYSLLTLADGKATLGELLAKSKREMSGDAMLKELLALWSARKIRIHPRNATV